MGLFDKKKSKLDAEFEALEEEIEEESSVEVVKSIPAPKPSRRSTPPQKAPPPAAPPPARYGIEKALELVRTLPPDVNEATLAIVRKTLESAEVRTEAVVEQVAQHQAHLEQEIGGVELEIAALEAQIRGHEEKIQSLREDLGLLAKVRLVFAPKSKGAPPPLPAESGHNSAAAQLENAFTQPKRAPGTSDRRIPPSPPKPKR